MNLVVNHRRPGMVAKYCCILSGLCYDCRNLAAVSVQQSIFYIQGFPAVLALAAIYLL